MDVQLDAPSQPRPARSVTNPRISVIIPVRNDPNRLAKCLEALSRSTVADYEVIVVDDASTDQTPQVAELLGAKVMRLPRNAGAAAARNAAAATARGPILLFIDADVCVQEDTLAVALATFDDPGIDAVFGSYDLDPGEPNLLSQYKNLAHRYYHQISSEKASTFWTGCGAIRRDVFNAFKFDAEQFKRPSIEDIELGARLIRAGRKIVINKKLQAKHLKRWTLSGIVRSDLFDRAIPWTRVILREKNLPGDLNLSFGQRVAAMLAALSTAIFFAACLFKPWLALLPVAVFGSIAVADRITFARPLVTIAEIAAIAAMTLYAPWLLAVLLIPASGIVILNAPFYRFFLTHRGLLFTAAVLPMHFAYYIYGLFGFAAGHLLHYRDALDDRRIRIRVYFAVTAALYAIGWALVLLRARLEHATIDFAVSDATGYYVYLPSLVIDHDLDFENQVAIQYPVPDKQALRTMRANRYPIGVALSIAPGFLIAHPISVALYRVTHFSWLAPNGYSILYFVFCVACAMTIGTLAMICADRLLAERFGFSGRIICAAILTSWLGTNLFWYYVREPFLAHMIGASWIIIAVYLIHRIQRNSAAGRLPWWQLPLLSLVMSIAIVCRMTNAFLFPMFAYLAVVIFRAGFVVRALKLIPLIILAMIPLLLEWITMKRIMGHNLAGTAQGVGYGAREVFYWTRPALLLSLFSSKHGLFFATPTLLFAAWGLIVYLKRTGLKSDPLVVCFILSALILWYVNSAWYAWWFGTSVGNRAYVELAGLFIIGFAFAWQWFARQSRRLRSIVLIALAASLAVNYGLMFLKVRHKIDDNKPLIPWEDQIFSGALKRI